MILHFNLLFLYFIFDWALITVSSLSGAALIIQALSLNPRLELGLFIALVILGIIIQAVMYQRSQAAPGEKVGP